MARHIKHEKVDVYHGETIHLDSYNRFLVESLENSYPTIEAAHEAIEKKHKVEASVKKEKFDPLPIIDINGERHLITGVHAGTGARLIKPNLERRGYGGTATYPDLPMIAEKIAEYQSLRDRESSIYSWLKEFELIETLKSYGETPDLLKNYRRLIDNYNEKKKLAESQAATTAA